MKSLFKKFIVILALATFCSNIFAMQHLAPTSNLKQTNEFISSNHTQTNFATKPSILSFIKNKLKFAGSALIILALFTGCATINPNTGTIFDPGNISQNGKTYKIEQKGTVKVLKNNPQKKLENLTSEKESGITSSIEFLKKRWLIDAVFEDQKVSSDFLNMALGGGGVLNLTNNYSAPRIRFNNKLYTNKRLIAEIFNSENGEDLLKALYATLLGFYLQEDKIKEVEVFGNYNDVVPLKTTKLLTFLVANKEAYPIVRLTAFKMLHSLHYLEFIDYFLDKHPNHNIYKNLQPHFQTISNLAGEGIVALFKPKGLMSRKDPIRDYIKNADYNPNNFIKRSRKLRRVEKNSQQISVFINKIKNGKPNRILQAVLKEEYIGPTIMRIGGHNSSA